MASVAASPVMVGAITVLIAILAVFLAYNANNGLPFVPTYRVSAQVKNADELLPGNEVRVGGVRVGVIENVDAIEQEDGSVTTKLDLSLNKDVEPLPVDSEVVVRARSALGLKYLEIDRGDSSEGYEAGSTMPLSASVVEPVDIDEFLQAFDEPTGEAIQGNLFEFGNALAGRGPQLNSAIGSLRTLLPPLERVTRTLANPRTQLGRFVASLSNLAGEVAPVAQEQADMFANLDTTFGAFANVARPYIQETISEGPPTLDVATRELPRIRPFLQHSTALFTELQPGIESLRVNAPTIASALEAGAPVLRDSPQFNRDLVPVAAALRRLNNDGSARDGIDRLQQTNTILDPTLRFITPGQTVCNYPALLLRNGAELLSLGSGEGGTFQRFSAFNPPSGPNDEGAPSSAPANGGGSQGNFLHSNPYPNTAAPNQDPIECEAGNEPYAVGQQVIGNPPGDQGTVTEDQ
jgi:virulence factor Mce-like protein